MTQMTIELSPDELTWAEVRVRSGRYESVESYLEALVRRDCEEEERRVSLRAELEKGERSGVSGRSLQDIYDDVTKRLDAA